MEPRRDIASGAFFCASSPAKCLAEIWISSVPAKNTVLRLLCANMGGAPSSSASSKSALLRLPLLLPLLLSLLLSLLELELLLRVSPSVALEPDASWGEDGRAEACFAIPVKATLESSLELLSSALASAPLENSDGIQTRAFLRTAVCWVRSLLEVGVARSAPSIRPSSDSP